MYLSFYILSMFRVNLDSYISFLLDLGRTRNGK